MRFLRLYLVAYFALVLGAAAALWQAGVLGELPPIWVALGLIVAIALGVILIVASTRPSAATSLD